MKAEAESPLYISDVLSRFPKHSRERPGPNAEGFLIAVVVSCQRACSQAPCGPHIQQDPRVVAWRPWAGAAPFWPLPAQTFAAYCVTYVWTDATEI